MLVVGIFEFLRYDVLHGFRFDALVFVSVADLGFLFLPIKLLLVTVGAVLFEELLDVAGIHEALDAKQLSGLNEREEDLGLDRSFAPVHEGQEVLHHGVAQVGDVDDGVSGTTWPGTGPAHKQRPEVGGAGGEH